MMYYIYILRCEDNSLYTGITTDLARRLAEHMQGGKKGAKYTRAKKVLRMEAAWEAPDRAQASKLERRIKAMTKSQKEALIAGEITVEGFRAVPPVKSVREEAEYTVIRSSRRSLAIEISRDGKVILRVPYACSDERALLFLKSREAWVKEHLKKQLDKIQRYPEPDEEEKARLWAKAREVIPQRVAYYAAIMGLEPTAGKITDARTRYGSCSGKNSLCFSWRLIQRPMEAVDYVVVHELAHIVHKNHGKGFYALLDSVLPDRRERERLL